MPCCRSCFGLAVAVATFMLTTYRAEAGGQGPGGHSGGGNQSTTFGGGGRQTGLFWYDPGSPQLGPGRTLGMGGGFLGFGFPPRLSAFPPAPPDFNDLQWPGFSYGPGGLWRGTQLRNAPRGDTPKA